MARIRELFIHAKRLPVLFIISYFIILVILSFYVSDINNAMSVDSYRLYSIDDADRYYYVHCLWKTPIVIFNPEVLPFHSLTVAAIAPLLNAAGVTGITAHRLVAAFFSMVSLAALYGIMRKLEFSDGWVMAGLLLVASNPLYLVLSILTLPEIILLAFVLFGVYSYYREKYFLSIIFISLAPLIRYQAYPLLGVWGLLYLYKFFKEHQPRYLLYIAVASLPTLASMVAQYLIFQNPIYWYTYLSEEMVLWTEFAGLSGSTSMENFMFFAPPIMYEYGYLFIALGIAGFFYTLRDKKYLLVNLSILLLLYELWYLVFFGRYMNDRRLLQAFTLASIPVTVLLTKIGSLKFKKVGMALAISLVSVMVFTNLYNLHVGVRAPGTCCDDGTYMPRDTMKWIESNYSKEKYGTMYINMARVDRLFVLDDNCVLAGSNARLYTEGYRADRCMSVSWMIGDVKHETEFPQKGIFITPSTNIPKCNPENVTLEAIQEIENDSVKIIKIGS
jgi:hypothetical protein